MEPREFEVRTLRLIERDAVRTLSSVVLLSTCGLIYSL
jgi:hypothetical protein